MAPFVPLSLYLYVLNLNRHRLLWPTSKQLYRVRLPENNTYQLIPFLYYLQAFYCNQKIIKTLKFVIKKLKKNIL